MKPDKKIDQSIPSVGYVLRILTTGAVFVIIVAMLLQNRQPETEDNRKSDILNALRSIERNFVRPEVPPKDVGDRFIISFDLNVNICIRLYGLFKLLFTSPLQYLLGSVAASTYLPAQLKCSIKWD